MNQTEKKKKKILDVTYALLKKKHISDISMEKIAEKAGVSKVTIFKYFESKNNLMNIVIRHSLQHMTSGIQEIIDNNHDYERTYNEITELKLKSVKAFPQVFSDNLMTQYARDPDFFDLDSRRMRTEMFDKVFQRGRDEGKIDPQFTDEFLHLFIDVIEEGMKFVDLEMLLPNTDSFVQAIINAFQKSRI